MVAIPAPKLTKPYAVFRLNTTRGITNVGSHPDNDIVIQDPAVQPFHMMLDHRQKPYQVYILSPDADVCISGVRLAGNESKAFYDFGQIQFAGYTLRAQEAGGDNPVEEVAVLPVESAAPTVYAPTAREMTSTAGPRDGNLGLAPAPRLEDVILLDLAGPQTIVNVEQAAVYTLTAINGGPIVASFDLQVEGVPQEWVAFEPARLNLYEGARAAFTVRITAPRDPTSLARTYPLQFVVTSPNYPGLQSAASAEFTLNPYDEYAVGNITPRSKSAPWTARSAQTSFTLSNFGNHPAGFKVSAQDDENGCQFSFLQPEGTILVKQADVQIEPGATVTVPLAITPTRRYLVRLGARQYQYTVTTQSLADPASTRTLPGTFISRPLFGLFSILLAVLIFLIGGYFLLKPRIDSFGVKNKIIRLGEPATLAWKVSPFTTNLQISGVADPIKAGQNQVSIVPANTATTYSLTAGNWLSSLLHLDIHSQPVTVLAIPSYPQIDTFTTDTLSLFQGDNLTIKWATKNATEVFLTVEGVTESLKPEEFSGTRTLPIKNNSLIVVQARNNSGTVERSAYVRATVPSARVVSFDVSPQTVTKGSPVTVSWEVTGDGVQSVMISPWTDPLPNTGTLTFFPDTSMEFVLTVKSRGDKQLQPELRSVGVLDAAVAPKINIFNVIPNKLTIPGNVEVSWSVTGATTDIVLTSLDGEIAHGLPAQGFRSVKITKTTSLILTAFNGTLSDAQSKDVEYSSLKPVQVTITNVTPNSGLVLGDKVLVQFSVLPLNSEGKPAKAVDLGYPELSGKVDVTNGFDNCNPVPELPATSCQLTLTRITGQPIQATYSGDANYARTTSAPYSYYSVSGNPAALTTHYTFEPLHGVSLVVGELFTIGFTFAPVSPVATVPVNGKVDVIDVTGGGNTVICQNVDLSNTDKNNPLNASGSCPMSGFTSVGQKSLKYIFKNSATYASSPPVDSSLYVGKADVVVSYLYDLSAQTVVGQSFPVTVVVRAKAPGGGIPTGAVAVWDNDFNTPENNCNPQITLDREGKGACNLTLWHASALDKTDPLNPVRVSKKLEAAYSGDANYTSGTAEDRTHVVIPASTGVSLSFSPSSSQQAAQVGQPLMVTFNVAAIGSGAGNPTGTIRLRLNGTDIAQCTLSYPTQKRCTLTLPPSLPSTPILTLQGYYDGSDDYFASNSGPQPYQIYPAVTAIQASASPADVAGKNDPITITASITTQLGGGAVPNGTITAQGNPPDPLETPTTCAYPLAAPCQVHLNGEGPRTITVTYTTSDANYQSTSTTLSYRIKRAVNLNAFTYQSTPFSGQTVSFNFSVSPMDNQGGIPTGTVRIDAANGSETISCSGNLSTGSCTIQFPRAVTYTLSVHYSGDGIFAAKDGSTTPDHLDIHPAVTQIPDVGINRNYINARDLFDVTMQVLNLSSSPVPSGVVYVFADTQNDCTLPNTIKTNGTSTIINDLGIGTVQNVSINTAGDWYINVYYEDPLGNFAPTCFAKWPVQVH